MTDDKIICSSSDFTTVASVNDKAFSFPKNDFNFSISQEVPKTLTITNKDMEDFSLTYIISIDRIDHIDNPPENLTI